MQQIQKSCPAAFWDKNYEACMQAQAVIIAAAKRFLAGEGGKTLPPSSLEQAEKALAQQPDVGKFFTAIRPHAHLFHGLDTFWRVVDAAGFFLDATTQHWKCMTEDARHRHLAWAMQEASEV